MIGLDVVHGGVKAGAGVQGDDPGGLQHLQGPAAVGQVVGDGDDIAVLQLVHGGDLVGEQAQGGDEGVADVLDLIAIAVDLPLEIDAVLEGVQVDLPVVQGPVGGDVVREVHQLQVDALLGQGGLGRGPQVLVDAAHDAQLHGDRLGSGSIGGRAGGGALAAGGVGVGVIAAAGGEGQGSQGGGQGKGDGLSQFHV